MSLHPPHRSPKIITTSIITIRRVWHLNVRPLSTVCGNSVCLHRVQCHHLGPRPNSDWSHHECPNCPLQTVLSLCHLKCSPLLPYPLSQRSRRPLRSSSNSGLRVDLPQASLTVALPSGVAKAEGSLWQLRQRFQAASEPPQPYPLLVTVALGPDSPSPLPLIPVLAAERAPQLPPLPPKASVAAERAPQLPLLPLKASVATGGSLLAQTPLHPTPGALLEALPLPLTTFPPPDAPLSYPWMVPHACRFVL